MFIRGGNANVHKVLVDGVPANEHRRRRGSVDVHHGRRRSDEVLRVANSVIAGTDALAGVISIPRAAAVRPFPRRR